MGAEAALPLPYIDNVVLSPPVQAASLQSMIIIPASLVAGCMFPIELMPAFMQKVAHFLPQYWVLDMIGKLQTGHRFGEAGTADILIAFALLTVYKFSRNNDMRSYYYMAKWEEAAVPRLRVISAPDQPVELFGVVGLSGQAVQRKNNPVPAFPALIQAISHLQLHLRIVPSREPVHIVVVDHVIDA